MPDRGTLKGFEAFCATLILEDGKPLKLLPYEKRILRDYFAGVRETVVILSKKNGKTTLLAALALYHLKTFPNAECVIAAASRDQARILFKQAAGLVHRSGLSGTFAVKPGYGEVRLTADGPHVLGARIRILAADSATADGVIPTLALVDELHRHPSADLYGVFRDGLGPRDGQQITISTAGASVESPLGLIRARAYELPGFRRDEDAKYTYARDDEGSFVLHEWCLSPTDDPDDLHLVKKVNPAPWQTIKALRERRNSPSTTPWQWARFACGLWTSGEEHYLTPEMWDACNAKPEIPDGAKDIIIGIDASIRRDSTAVVTIYAPEGDTGPVHAKWNVWTPTEEADVPLSEVEDYVRHLATVYPDPVVSFDPRYFSQAAQHLEAEGIRMYECPQTDTRMVPSTQAVWEVVSSGRLRHGGDPIARRHALAATVKATEGGLRISKSKTKAQIDCLSALQAALEALSRAPKPAQRESAYAAQMCDCGAKPSHLRRRCPLKVSA